MFGLRYEVRLRSGQILTARLVVGFRVRTRSRVGVMARPRLRGYDQGGKKVMVIMSQRSIFHTINPLKLLPNAYIRQNHTLRSDCFLPA